MSKVFTPSGLSVALLAITAGMLVYSARQQFATIDEPGHIVAGISHWQTGTHGLYCVNPPLARMIAVLPALAAKPDTRSCIPSDYLPGAREEFAVGERFAYWNAPRFMDLVFLARLAGIGWWLAGAAVTYLWARGLYSPKGGLLALIVWCIEPNLLAHAQLVTPDVPGAVAGLAASYVFWRYLQNPSWISAWFSGLLLGVALLTKFTMLILLIVWPILALAFFFCADSTGNSPVKLGTKLCQLILTFLVGLLVVNFGYEFDGTGTRLGAYTFISQNLKNNQDSVVSGGNRFRDTWLESIPVPLPADYLRGIDVQKRDFESGHLLSYLHGAWRFPGWWYWYFYALAVKVPLGICALVLWSLILTLFRHPASGQLRDELCLWLPALAILILLSSQSGYTMHLRYALPLFPFLIVSLGKLAWYWNWERWRMGMLLMFFVLWSGASSLAAYPHHLCYFNELVGGPENGHVHLVDSNIDWGQDLLFLKKWQEDHPEAHPLYLAHYGLVLPRLAGIDYQVPPMGKKTELPFLPTPSLYEAYPNLLPDPPKFEIGPQPGYYAISVNYLRGHTSLVYPRDKEGWAWSMDDEGFDYVHQLGSPVAKAGYSIFIFHLTREEANKLRSQLGYPPILDH